MLPAKAVRWPEVTVTSKEQKSEPSGSGPLVKPSRSGATLGRNDIQVVGKHEHIVG